MTQKPNQPTNTTHQTAGKDIYNIGKIKNARFNIAVKGSVAILLIGLLAIGLWQREAIEAGLGMDRFFEQEDENFKILVLPFKQECTLGGKNYDAGYVLTYRLKEIARNEQLKIVVKYWSDYTLTDQTDDQKAWELQQYHYTDMLIYGRYQTSDCSAEGDQICINYITDEKWNMGKAGTKLDNAYAIGGFDDLKKGKLQERVEDIAFFISILGQIKSIDHDAYLKKLQGLLDKPNFSSTSKAFVYADLSEKLVTEGGLEKPLDYYKKALDIFVANQDSANIAISYSKLGETHSSLGNLDKALRFFEERSRLGKELYAAYPQNVSFKNGLAISYAKLGVFNQEQLKNNNKARFYFEKAEQIWIELVKDAPQYVKYQDFLKKVQNILKSLE